MKTKYRKFLAFGAAAIIALVSACHSNSRDSTDAADSVNQKKIAATDSANKSKTNISDSANHAKTVMKEDASEFLVKNFEAGLFEIQLAELAGPKSLDADVQKLSATVLGSRNAINTRITAIAAATNYILPTAINAGHQKSLDDLAKLTGADFDRKYVDLVIDEHKEAASDYKDAYKNMAPCSTRTFAAETLPKIQDHLELAKKIKARIK
jgi:putative membrane protein